eukprot:1157960-Pelagomonas_calceolata.AAC.4
MADQGPCCSSPLLPLQWLSSSCAPAAGAAATLITGLAVLVGVSHATAPTNVVSWWRLSKEGVIRGDIERGKVRLDGAPDHPFRAVSLKPLKSTTTHHRAWSK